uniref:Uncharacterized protein n=1 Tax=Arion vulgaris TaxID=1028688 RepID=A0A0B6Z624_9EUPU
MRLVAVKIKLTPTGDFEQGTRCLEHKYLLITLTTMLLQLSIDAVTVIVSETLS